MCAYCKNDILLSMSVATLTTLAQCVLHRMNRIICINTNENIRGQTNISSLLLLALLMVYKFRNLLGLLESAIMLQTSTLEINV